MNTPTFTPEPPTKPGWYLWRASMFHEPKVYELFQTKLGIVVFGRLPTPEEIGGLWCRLVPAEEVHRAFVEAQLIDYKNCAVPNYAGLTRFENSRARKVMEGEA